MDGLQQILIGLALLALLVLLRTVGLRHLPRAAPPLRLPSLAVVVWLLASHGPLTLLPAALLAWVNALKVWVACFALIRLASWLFLELPDALGWWTKPPKILRDLGMLLAGAALLVIVLQQQARINLVGLVTTSAVLTAIIGLAAQETLKDLFAGISLQIDCPFQEGDFLQLENAKGIVVSLTLMNTLLRALDGELLIVPNSEVAQSVLRRFQPGEPVGNRFSLGLDYGLPPAQARALLERVIHDHPDVLKSPESKVWVDAFADSAITYQLLVWHRDPRDRARYQLRSELLEQFWYALQRAGQSIPYPVREIRPKRISNAGHDFSTTSLEQRQQQLGTNSLFAGLKADQLTTLAALTRPLSFGPGETIVREGDHGDSLYQLVAGKVEVLKGNPSGETLTSVAQLGPGEIFGEMTLCVDSPRSATVRTLSECVLLEVNRSALQPLLAADGQLLESLAGLVSQRRAQLDQIDLEASPIHQKQMFERMRQIFSSLLSG